MPKKGGKSKKKGKKAKQGNTSKNADVIEISEEPVVDREQLLLEELEKVAKEVETAKRNVTDLKVENEWLQEEAQKIRSESHEYMSFMEKRLDKRQKALITLHDNNEHEIKELLHQRTEMLQLYEGKKNELKTQLLKKENDLSKAKQELEELTEFKKLKDEQADLIKQLEKEAQNLRIQHSEQLQVLKASFINEKKEFETQSEEKITKLSKESYKEAVASLVGYSNSTKMENRQLRKELTYLISQTKLLQEHKRKLENQQAELTKEKDFAKDISLLRNLTTQKFIKTGQ